MNDVVVDLRRRVTQTDRGSRASEVDPRSAGLGGDMAKFQRSTATKETDSGALRPPAEERDPDWAARIAKAREAREAAQKVRKGKPATFPSRVVP